MSASFSALPGDGARIDVERHVGKLGPEIAQDRHGEALGEGRRQQDPQGAARLAALAQDLLQRRVDALKAFSTTGSRRRPASVRVGCCGLRSKSGTPRKSSSPITWRLTALCETRRLWAAAVKLPMPPHGLECAQGVERKPASVHGIDCPRRAGGPPIMTRQRVRPVPLATRARRDATQSRRH